MKQEINFTKMHGAGNDYIYVYVPENPIHTPEKLSILWSRYHFGIGSDGLILIDHSDKADFSMRIFNNDGSEAMMCGNGVRCVGKFVHDHNLTDKEVVSVATLSGIKYIKLHTKDGEVISGTVDMGEPSLENKKQLSTDSGKMIDGVIEAEGKQYKGTYVCMGNPHFVIFVDNINDIEPGKVGPILEHHPIFPERCNIEFAQLTAPDTLRTRVWERGSGITLACGTGACATAVAAYLTGHGSNRLKIQMDGGLLEIEWNQETNHIFLTGPTEQVFEGTIYLDVEDNGNVVR